MMSISATVVTSTILVANIHCPSCVSYATDVLSRFIDSIVKIDISIIDQVIRVQHVDGLSEQLTQELVDAAFEVEHVTVTSVTGEVLRDYDTQSADPARSNNFYEKFFMSKAQRKHIENCNACQAQRQRPRYSSGARWTDILRKRRTKTRSTSTDIERGILRGSSSAPEPHVETSHTGQNGHNAYNEKHIVVLSIEGMTCASCVSALTTELQHHDYIQDVNVNLVANRAVVTFCGPESKAQDIKEKIEDIGYGAIIDEIKLLEQVSSDTDVHQATIAIEGMTCGSCSGSISRGLQELEFLTNVSVDLLGNSAVVSFHGKDNINKVVEKISDLGYDAHVVEIEKTGSLQQDPEPVERSVEFEISGMYCPKCPENMVAAVRAIFAGSITISQEPTLKIPRLKVQYRPSPPNLTIRHLMDTINSVDSGCSAKVYHPPSLEERSQMIQRRERNRILRHLLVTLLIAIPSFIVGIVYMSLVPTHDPTRQWFEQAIWSGNAMRIDWALFIMTSPAMFYGASFFHTRALKEVWTLWRPKSQVPLLRRFYRFGSMNLLISLGTSVAYFASLAVLIMDATTPRQAPGMERKSSTYFDTVTFLTLFILVGRFLEAYSKAKTGDSVSMLANLRPSTALLVETEGGNNDKADRTALKEISVDLLEVGDTITIPHGACPPADSIVAQQGIFLFDESSLTGESRPVEKRNGDQIYSGSINTGDPVQVTVTKLGGKSMLDQIISVVREGQAKRAPIERLADTLTGYFTPVITLLAIVTWIVWMALGESGRLPQGWLDVEKGGWSYWSVEFAIAVFVVACPCGIGLAAPTALFVGGGLAAKQGILVQGGGEAFQEASKLHAIVFDKTGTLTEGRMRVSDVEMLANNEEIGLPVAFKLARVLEEASTHPIAKAVVKHCDEALTSNSDLHVEALDIKELPGQGMWGRFEVGIGLERKSYEAVIGNQRLLQVGDIDSVSTSASQEVQAEPRALASNVFLTSALSRFQLLGSSTAILAIRPPPSSESVVPEYKPLAVFAIDDPLRPEAPHVIASLRSQGLDVYMCTGDNPQTARSIASQLSIPLTNIRAGVLPQDKASYIQELQGAATSRRTVAFVGDGTNDTPALTVADVSVALSHPEGGGSDIALTSSSFVLLNSDLRSILKLVTLSQRVFLRVKLNFAWAAVYNLCLIPVAAGVFFPVGATWGEHAHGGFRLNPVWASVAMAGSSVSVVLSSLALRFPELEVGQMGKWLKGRVTA